jgi:uncharacterized protein YbjT (DUF2867 family)
VKVAVAGGTGLLGRLVVQALSEMGDQPIVLARSRGVDLTSGAGVEAALVGCDAVVDATNITTVRRRPAVRFFESVTRHLLGGAQGAGVAQVVAVSIVGVDSVDYGYFLGKRRQEQLLAAGLVPWTLLRATQFHEFAGQVVARGGLGPVVAVPEMLCQPVAAAEAAGCLVRLVHDGPQRVALPIAGPQRLAMAEMVRGYLRATGQQRIVVPFRFPGKVGAAMATGGLIPDGPFRRGETTFDAYLSGLAVDPRTAGSVR